MTPNTGKIVLIALAVSAVILVVCACCTGTGVTAWLLSAGSTSY